MKFPFFAITVLITILCFILFVKSIDYGRGWAIALSVVGLLTFFILSILALQYQLRQHENLKGQSSHH